MNNSEVNRRAVYIGQKLNGLRDMEIEFADPHRGVAFENAASTIDCWLDNVRVKDISPVSAVPSFALIIDTLCVRPKVTNSKFLDVVGTSWAVQITSPTAVFDNNEVASVHGEAGALGVTVSAAASVKGNVGRGTKLAGSPDSAVFNLASSATLVNQMGPNIDEANPRMGRKVRNVGFAAGPYRLYTTYDPPNLAAGASVSPSPTFSVQVLRLATSWM